MKFFIIGLSILEAYQLGSWRSHKQSLWEWEQEAENLRIAIEHLKQEVAAVTREAPAKDDDVDQGGWWMQLYGKAITGPNSSLERKSAGADSRDSPSGWFWTRVEDDNEDSRFHVGGSPYPWRSMNPSVWYSSSAQGVASKTVVPQAQHSLAQTTQ
jgi:hypothetical protein